MKFSVAICSSNCKPVPRKPKVDEDAPAREYITEFVEYKTLGNNRVIILPKENEWRPEKKMKSLDICLQSTTEFELESSYAAAADSSFSFGLNLRKTSKSENGSAAVHHDESVEAKKLKQEVKELPDVQTLEDFAEVPVEGFGAALLAGYGWTEGRGIGRNAKEDVKIVEYNRGFAKQGFAFFSSAYRENLGKTGEPKEDGNLKKSEFERSHLEKRKEEDKRKREEGPRGGRDGHKNGLSKKCSSRRGGRERHKNGLSRKLSSRSEEGSIRRREVGKITPWLTSDIRVRVISKDFKGGRLYLKKGKILDVVGPTTCDISMDESRELIQGVDQELLETALPPRGGPVVVLFGKHKGAYGSLVERDSEQETGVVRDADSHALLNVRLEQIAEYVGDPS